MGGDVKQQDAKVKQGTTCRSEHGKENVLDTNSANLSLFYQFSFTNSRRKRIRFMVLLLTLAALSVIGASEDVIRRTR